VVVAVGRPVRLVGWSCVPCSSGDPVPGSRPKPFRPPAGPPSPLRWLLRARGLEGDAGAIPKVLLAALRVALAGRTGPLVPALPRVLPPLPLPVPAARV
jgi:hypothetical protein